MLIVSYSQPSSLIASGRSAERTYSQIYENRAILTADSSPTRHHDDVSETSSRRSSVTTTRNGRRPSAANQRARSAGEAPRTPAANVDGE